MNNLKVAIIDLSRGNILSVKQAFSKLGVNAYFVSRPEELNGASIIILPGVGAFGQAMKILRDNGLDAAIIDKAKDTLIVGICLGMQLLFSQSEEFGLHEGLGLLPGTVKRLPQSVQKVSWGLKRNKVPHIGWNNVKMPQHLKSWENTAFKGIEEGTPFYFMHSYYVESEKTNITTGITRYGDIEFSSAIETGNIKAFQFHPERSAVPGQDIYKNIINLFCL